MDIQHDNNMWQHVNVDGIHSYVACIKITKKYRNILKNGLLLLFLYQEYEVKFLLFIPKQMQLRSRVKVVKEVNEEVKQVAQVKKRYVSKKEILKKSMKVWIELLRQKRRDQWFAEQEKLAKERFEYRRNAVANWRQNRGKILKQEADEIDMYESDLEVEDEGVGECYYCKNIDYCVKFNNNVVVCVDGESCSEQDHYHGYFENYLKQFPKEL